MEHARRIANATGVHRHVDDLLLDLGGVTGVAVLQEESAPVAYRLLATIALLALAGLPMADDVGPLAVGAMQDLHNHAITGWLEGCSASHTPRENSRPTPLKHPPLLQQGSARQDHARQYGYRVYAGPLGDEAAVHH